MENISVKLYETRTISDSASTAGVSDVEFHAVTGSRLLVSFVVTAIDPGTSIQFDVDNTFNESVPWDTLASFSSTSTGLIKRVFSDFHNAFRLRVTVTGPGTVTYKVGVTLFDNAIQTKIENATIDVNLNHTLDAEGRFDSVRVGDGEDLLEVNEDGSVNTHGTFEQLFPLIAGSKWMDLAVYDEISPVYSNANKTLTMAYKEDGITVGSAEVNFNSLTDWNFRLSRFVNDDDGETLQDDDDSLLTLD